MFCFIVIFFAISSFHTIRAVPQYSNGLNTETDPLTVVQSINDNDLVSLNSPQHPDCTVDASADTLEAEQIDNSPTNLGRREENKKFCPVNIAPVPATHPNGEKTNTPPNGNPTDPRCPDPSKSELVTCAGPEVVDGTTHSSIIAIVLHCIRGAHSAVPAMRPFHAADGDLVNRYCCNDYIGLYPTFEARVCVVLQPAHWIGESSMDSYRRFYWRYFNQPHGN